MKMPRLLLTFLACACPVFSLTAQTGEAPPAPEKTETPADVKPVKKEAEYIRFVQDETSARMELATRTFTREDGTTVDLVGVVHIADASYYATLNKRLAEYDAVLYELVGDPEAVQAPPAAPAEEGAPAEPPSMQFKLLHMLYDAMGKYLKLAFQLQHIDYTSERFIHADVSASEFARLQAENGESLLTFMAQAMAMQNGEEMREMQQLDVARLLFILMSPKAADEFKVVLARVLSHTESIMTKIEDNKSSVILGKRNEIAMEKLRQTLALGKYHRLAVFYGAAHMPGMAEEMMTKMGFRPTGKSWLPAWTMDVPLKPAPAAPPAEAGKPQP